MNVNFRESLRGLQMPLKLAFAYFSVENKLNSKKIRQLDNLSDNVSAFFSDQTLDKTKLVNNDVGLTSYKVKTRRGVGRPDNCRSYQHC